MSGNVRAIRKCENVFNLPHSPLCSPSETELISSEDTLQSNPIHSWLNIHHTLAPFLSENFILGRPYLNWRHAIFRSEIQHRYVKSDLMRRRIHTELANAFYLGFSDVRRFYFLFFGRKNLFYKVLPLRKSKSKRDPLQTI